MARYRKKPVVIEAVQWYGKYTDGTEWPDWFRNGVKAGTLTFCHGRHPAWDLQIYTLEGVMRADLGDWVIKGVAGELYPCKHEIFLATYEPE